MLLLDTKQETWCYMCTVTIPTLVNKKNKAEWAAIIFDLNTNRPLQIT